MPDRSTLPDSLRLTRIRVYPLKGAAGYDLADTRLDELGVPLDRRWMLADPQGDFVSQRTHPRLALLRVRPWDGGVKVEAPGMDPLHLVIPADSGERTEVRVFGNPMTAVVHSGEASGWFADFLSEPFNLVFLPDGAGRDVDPEFAPGHRVSFADGYPLHLASESSLEDLNSRLRDAVDMGRFRPNLVVAGGEPWEEDTWREVEIGKTRLELVKPCARCQVTVVDQSSGALGAEPLKTLGVFRRFQGKVYFGQNAVLSETGGLRVGDDVRILKRGSRRPAL
ncbi:MOSC domain-containing protein [Gemmatimonadota bacterium]